MSNRFKSFSPLKGKVFIETYGCQMNIGDSEIVASILGKANYEVIDSVSGATMVLINTCAVRDNAEQKIYSRLLEFRSAKHKGLIVGVIGCMAERLGEDLLDMADIVIGPDAYRQLPKLIEEVRQGGKGLNTELSTTETYAEIQPIRYASNGVSAYVSIMRGCNNFCSFCVVPYTRGRERSRSSQTIISEIQNLLNTGYKEVTLLGQNVNSYRDGDIDFPKLMEMVAQLSPELRVRFSTSHPKDLSDELIEVMRVNPNIARSIHLPVQSGSNTMLKAMNRNYTIEWYMGRLEAIKRAMPDCSISTDIIAGFCSESEDDHRATIEIMERVGYDYAYMFAYSDRPGTRAHKVMEDNIEHDVKIRRLNEIISTQNSLSLRRNREDIGKIFSVLIEGHSKRGEHQLKGRSSQNKVIIFETKEGLKAGDYVNVRVVSVTQATLMGELV